MLHAKTQGQSFQRDAAHSTGGANSRSRRLGRHNYEGGGAAGTAALDRALLHGGSVGWRLEDNHVTFNSWRQTHADAAFNAAGNCARWSRAGALPAPQGAAPDRRSDVTPQIRLHGSTDRRRCTETVRG